MTISATSQGLKPGVCTSTNRPANPYDGMMIYETDTDKVAVYDSSAWVYKTGTTAPATPTAPGLVRVGGGTMSGSATTFSSVFSATYDAYQIVFSNLVGSAGVSLVLTFGSTTTGYYGGFIGVASDGTVSGYGLNNGSSINRGIRAQTTGGGTVVNVQNPFLTQRTFFQVSGKDINTAGGADNAIGAGFVDNATSYTAFTITSSGGTCTGTVNIYGYALS